MSASDVLDRIRTATRYDEALEILRTEGLTPASPEEDDADTAMRLSHLKLAASRCRTVDQLVNELARFNPKSQRASAFDLIGRADPRNSATAHRAPRDEEKSRVGKADASRYSAFGHFLGEPTDKQCDPDDVREIHLMLRKRTKNNVILCAPAGSGKTTLVETIAASDGEDSYFCLDLPRLIAGTKYRGELETKFMTIIHAARAERFVIFIDEIHSLVSMGNAEGSVGVLDLLKPHLTSPDFRVIGATTPRELPRLTSDPAFRRRFNFVQLSPLSREQLSRLAERFGTTSGSSDLSHLPIPRILDRLDADLPSEGYPEKLVDFLEYLEALRLSPQLRFEDYPTWSAVFDRFIAHRFPHSSPLGE